MSCHNHVATKRLVLWIEHGEGLALLDREDVAENCAAFRVEGAFDLLPVEGLHVFFSCLMS